MDAKEKKELIESSTKRITEALDNDRGICVMTETEESIQGGLVCDGAASAQFLHTLVSQLMEVGMPTSILMSIVARSMANAVIEKQEAEAKAEASKEI